MMKRIVTIVALLALVFTLPTFAAQQRSPAIFPGISFSGTTATCTVDVYADNATDSIYLDAELWQGNTLVKSWSGSGQGDISSVRTATVTRGKAYTLKAYVTINNKDYPEVTITRTCP